MKLTRVELYLFVRRIKAQQKFLCLGFARGFVSNEQ